MTSEEKHREMFDDLLAPYRIRTEDLDLAWKCAHLAGERAGTENTGKIILGAWADGAAKAIETQKQA